MSNQPDFTPELTADGSYTFFSTEFGEWFHSRGGAYDEAKLTFVEATQLRQKAHQARLCLLDICYGLGYNTAAALETIWRVNPNCQIQLVGLEINQAVPLSAIACNLVAGWSPTIGPILAKLASEHQVRCDRLEAQLLFGDAREQIQSIIQIGLQADAIFLDPFSPPRCPSLWTVEFLQQLATCLRPDGRLATYSCAAAVRTALQLAGLKIGSSQATGRHWPGTVASFTDHDLPPLSCQEQEHLLTRAAIPYRDPTLKASAQDIVQRRQQEQTESDFEPTSRWRKRWLRRQRQPSLKHLSELHPDIGNQ